MCLDSPLENVKNKQAMQNSWTVNVGSSDDKAFSSLCGSTTFFGWTSGAPVGKVGAIFKGTGTATLNFGNCFTQGTTKVTLNNVQLGIAGASQKNVPINFNFKVGDQLSIEEHNGGIIIINSLKIQCPGEWTFIN